MIYKNSIKIRGVEFKNRFIMAPVKTGYGSPKGEVNERHLSYYNNVSKGGASMIILEPVAVTSNGKEHPKQLCIHNEDSAEQLKKIVDVLHKNNCMACLNINHAGRAANPKATGGIVKAPSICECPASGAKAEELSVNEIDEILSAYESALNKAVKSGFDAVEVQCGHGYLISQFLSERINKRNDEYGKDKSLFLKKVLEIVSKFKDKFLISIRISANEFVEGEDTLRLNSIILGLAKEYGIDLVHCGLGNACDTPPWYYSHMALPEKMQLEAVKAIRKMTDIPLIVAGRMADIDKIKQFEQENLADFIAFGRPMVADPELVNKILNDSYEDITYCGYCLQGCLANVKNGIGLGCIVNPEIDKPELKPSGRAKKVAVIGGGPAGMSAAITLTKLGHYPTLFERDGKLGGQFLLAPLAPAKDKMNRPLNSMIKKCMKYVKDIRLNKEFDKSDLDDFDSYIIATGSKQNIPDIEGLDTQYVITSIEFFKNEKEVKGKRILIIGAGMTGIEAAELLANKGYEIVITKRTDTIANDMEMITKNLMMKRLANKANLKIMPNTTITKFTEDKVYGFINNPTENKADEIIFDKFDTVIIASGMKPVSELKDEIEISGKKVFVIGDAKEPKDIYAATKEGYEAALNI